MGKVFCGVGGAGSAKRMGGGGSSEGAGGEVVGGLYLGMGLENW